jgi:hypothetical protein
MPSVNTFKTEAQRALPAGITEFFETYGVNKELIQSALRDVHKAYSASMSALRKKKIKRFRLKYKSFKTMSIELTATNFSTKVNGFCVDTYGPMKSQYPIIGINKSCRVTLTNGKFILFRPVDKQVKTVEGRIPICALDPGSRAFQTLHSTETDTKICEASFNKYTCLRDKILNVVDGEARCVARGKEIIRLKKLEKAETTNVVEQRKIKRMKKTYPDAYDRISIEPVDVDKKSKRARRKVKHRVRKRRKPRKQRKNKKHRRRGANGLRITRMQHIDNVRIPLANLEKKEAARIQKSIDADKVPRVAPTYQTKKAALEIELAAVREQYKLSNCDMRHTKVRHTKETRPIEIKAARKNKRIRDKIRHLTEDMHWKLANDIVKNYDEVAIGNMSTQSITSSKSKLNQATKNHILALGHYGFRTKLKSKGKEYSCEVHTTDEFRTSMACSDCATLNRKLGSLEVYNCDACGMKKDRDCNGATNILKVHQGTFLQTRKHAAEQKKAAKAARKKLVAQKRKAKQLAAA